ncbi:hypothetical protein B0H11DRAFT_2299181 [Mycena galericulata]|nr:hypothetical protein B0H11DRAFT_2299181 [Mycena galericulata]
MSAFNFSILHGRLHANLSQAFPSFRVQCPRHKNPGCFHPRRGQFHEVNEQFVQQGSTVRDYDISAFTGHSFTVNADITLKIPAASLSLLDDAVPLTYICQDLSKHADTSLSPLPSRVSLPHSRYQRIDVNPTLLAQCVGYNPESHTQQTRSQLTRSSVLDVIPLPALLRPTRKSSHVPHDLPPEPNSTGNTFFRLSTIS